MLFRKEHIFSRSFNLKQSAELTGRRVVSLEDVSQEVSQQSDNDMVAGAEVLEYLIKDKVLEVEVV